ncbi:hypothetical protein D3C76_213280 [compost metagenome]
MPDSRGSRQRESFMDNVPQHLHAVHHQLQTLRTYTSSKSAYAYKIEHPLIQKRELAVHRSEQAGQPITLARKRNSEAVSGSAGTAVEAQHSPPSLNFRPSQGSPPYTSPSLQLGLGPGVAAALEKLENWRHPQNPLQQEPASLHKMPQPLAVRRLLLLAAPSESQGGIQLQGSTQLSSTERSADASGPLSEAPKPGLVHTAGEPGAPSVQRRRARGSLSATAGPEQKEHIPPEGRYSRLILRKPEAAKAAGQEPVQQQPEAVLQERAVQQQLKARSSPVAAAPAATMDTAELNQLAERVYQVLEKKMAIRKDRRGLR